MMYWAGQEDFSAFWSALTYKQRMWLSRRARNSGVEKMVYAGRWGVPEDENINVED